MSTIHDTTGLRRATAGPQVYSPLEIYWAAFQAWRRRAKIRADLIALSDRELLDIGISRGEVDYVATTRDIDPRGNGG